MKKIIILLMAGLMMLTACQKSSIITPMLPLTADDDIDEELKALPSNYVHPAVKYFKAIGLRLLCLGLLYAVSEDGAKIVACLYLLYFGVSFMAYLVLELASTMPSIMSL